ncbi:MAG: DUF4097 family beta strand repeat-containing protein [Candidatus Dormiibacterota bacterium]
MTEWEIESAETIQFDETPSDLVVELVGGDVSVTTTDGPSSLEVRQIQGPMVLVQLEGGRLGVRQKQPDFWAISTTRVSASVTLAVPAGCRVRIDTVSASVLVKGLEADLAVKTVSGETTLESLGGPVTAETVSGDVASRGQRSKLRGETVSGGVTLDAFGGSSVRLQTVSGEVVADLKQAEPDSSAEVQTVSGAVYLRLPASPSQKVRVESVSGRLTSAFPELRTSSGPGSHALKGSLGEGRGKVKVSTVSGSVSLLEEPTT